MIETPHPASSRPPPSGALGFVVDFFARMESHRTLERAGSLAFDLFLSLLPLFALGGWVLVHYAGPELRERASETLVRFAPGGAGELIDTQFELLDQSGRALAPASIVAFAWAASAGMHTLLAALRAIHGGEELPWWNVRLRSLTFVAFTGAAGPLAAFALSRASHAPIAMFRHLADLASSIVFRSSALVSAFALVALFIAGAHRMALGKSTRWRASLLGALLWCMASYGFSRYVALLGSYSVFYGSLASVVLLLLWIWLTSLTILVAAELDATARAWRKTTRRTALAHAEARRGVLHSTESVPPGAP